MSYVKWDIVFQNMMGHAVNIAKHNHKKVGKKEIEESFTDVVNIFQVALNQMNKPVQPAVKPPTVNTTDGNHFS